MRIAATILLALSLAVPGFAQAPVAGGRTPITPDVFFRPGTIAISIYGGGAAFTDFQRGVAETTDGTLSFQRRLSGSTTAGVAAEVVTWFSPHLGARVHGSWLPTRFDVKYDPTGTRYMRLRNGTAPDWKRLHFWTLDASVLIRPSFSIGRFAPYAILGGGMASYQVRGEGELPPEARSAFASGSRSTWMIVGGLGAVVPLQRRGLLLSFALTDHVTPTPLNDEGGGEVYQEGDLTIRVADPRETGSDGVSLTGNFRLMVGLTLPLGRIGG
jgi:hypothetical protein